MSHTCIHTYITYTYMQIEISSQYLVLASTTHLWSILISLLPFIFSKISVLLSFEFCKASIYMLTRLIEDADFNPSP